MSDKDASLTQSLLREFLDYNTETGDFYWKVNRTNIKAGTPAGTTTANGYLVIRLFRKLYLAHRLAWLYMHDDPMPRMLDHKNGNKRDNRINNLRPANKVTNGQNRHAAQANNKSSGLLGVAWLSHVNKFTAYINSNGTRTYLGLFADKHEAHAAYLTAKRKLHQGCTI